MEEKIDKILEEITSLRNQIQKLIVQSTVGEDQALVTYLQNKNVVDFMDVECKKALNDYINFKDNISPYLPNISQRAFNRTIRNMFPELSIGTTTRNKSCVQYFKRK